MTCFWVWREWANSLKLAEVCENLDVYQAEYDKLKPKIAAADEEERVRIKAAKDREARTGMTTRLMKQEQGDNTTDEFTEWVVRQSELEGYIQYLIGKKEKFERELQ
jgi:hypothetical protein